MSTTDDDGGEGYPTMPRRATWEALVRIEAKVDVAIAQHQARLDEHSRRLHDLSLVQAEHTHRIGMVEQSQAASDAVQHSKPAPQAWPVYVSVGITLVLGVLYLIQNYGA